MTSERVDLLTELRRPEAVLSKPYKSLADLCREAADEIERLRAAMGEIAAMRREDLYYGGDPDGTDNAAAAAARDALRRADA